MVSKYKQLGENKILFTITAVADPAPNASSIQYSMLIPFANAICVEVDIENKLIKIDPPDGLLEF